MISGFPPIAGKTATILILGTMPGEESLRKQEYYAHPRNAFWRIMGSLLGFEPATSYEKKTRHLLDHNIALWDVMFSCERKGSLDSNIKSKSIVENDFARLFSHCPGIKNVYFNGARAEQEYVKRVIPLLPKAKPEINYARLPSSSPAMARLSLSDKITEWSKITRIKKAKSETSSFDM